MWDNTPTKQFSQVFSPSWYLLVSMIFRPSLNTFYEIFIEVCCFAKVYMDTVLVDEFCDTTGAFHALLPEVWFEPGDRLLAILALKTWGRNWFLILWFVSTYRRLRCGQLWNWSFLNYQSSDLSLWWNRSINQRLIEFVFSVLLLGGTQDLGDNASDIKDIGDWLDGWAYIESWAAQEIERLCWKLMVQQ